MMRLITLVCALALGAATKTGADAEFETVPELKVEKYLGRWYQVYTDKANAYAVQRNGTCVTADYGVSPERSDTVTVHNSENVGSADGRLRAIDGTATIDDPSEPGKLTVMLNGVPVPGEYWVVALGTETFGPHGLYSWAVVTDSKRDSLFVLARDPDEFHGTHEMEVFGVLQGLKLPSPVKTVQTGCTYDGHSPSTASSVTVTSPSLFSPTPRYTPQIHTHTTRDLLSLNMRSRGLTTVTDLDIDAYTGRWYQAYSNLVVASTIEYDGYCATADYQALPSGDGVTVFNAQNQGRPTGPLSTISGKATISDPSNPGQLTVRFDSVPFPGSYWVIKLGPKAYGKYQYAVVTDRTGTTLFVLTRDIKVFEAQYEDDVLQFVEPLFQGFVRRPLATFQGPRCNYSAPPAEVTSPVRHLRPQGNAHRA